MEINKDSKNEIKEQAKLYVKKITQGCGASNCFNKYCKSSPTFAYSALNKTQQVASALQLLKQGTKIDCLVLDSSPEISLQSLVKEFSDFNLNLKIDNGALQKAFQTVKIKLEFILEILVSPREAIKKAPTHFHTSLYPFYLKALVFVVLHPNFSFSIELNRKFQQLCSLIKLLSTSANTQSLPLSDLSEQMVQRIVTAFHDFLSVYLFQTLNSEYEDTSEYCSIDILIDFLQVFDLFHESNKKHKVLHFSKFYNDAINENFDLNNDCKIYFKNLAKNTKKFCFLDYSWLFNASQKFSILNNYHNSLQRNEMIKEVNSMNSLILDPKQAFYITLKVNRDNIVEDTMNFVSGSDRNFKKELKIEFVGEDGVDEGGVKKEFFLLFVREVFDANYGMFKYNEELRFFWFNQFSFECSLKFELIGIIFGLALFNGVILDVNFPLAIFKKMLDFPCEIGDLEEIDRELHRNLKYISESKEENLEDILGINFTVSVENWGKNEIVPLIEGGEDVQVTSENKDEYVKAYLKWFFYDSIDKVFQPFLTGFDKVCNIRKLKIIRPEELKLIVCGSDKLDFSALKESCRYDDGFEEDSQTIKDFWEVVLQFDEEKKKKFLFFTTGCDKAPIGGLSNLTMTISRGGPDSPRLPSAHTCFNHLLLPDYKNKDKLEKLLTIAIENSKGFGLQ